LELVHLMVAHAGGGIEQFLFTRCRRLQRQRRVAVAARMRARARS
jgi:hypothetical protein